MNKQEQISFCSKYNCTTDDISKVLKAMVTNTTHSQYYRDIYSGDTVSVTITPKEAYDYVWTQVSSKGFYHESMPDLLKALLERKQEQPKRFS